MLKIHNSYERMPFHQIRNMPPAYKIEYAHSITVLPYQKEEFTFQNDNIYIGMPCDLNHELYSM